MAIKNKPRNSAQSGGDITIMRLSGAWSDSLRGYRRKMDTWCRAGLSGQKATVSIVLADDQYVRELNHQYRGKNKPTNVLSFQGDAQELGDIVLGLETIKREAKEQKKSFADHTAHLIVHGVLHLRGFDHEQEKDAGKMETQEIAILKKLGIANPYEAR